MLLLVPAIAEAHRPVFVGPGAPRPDRARPITDPEISWALYGRLDARGTRQYFGVRGRPGFDSRGAALLVLGSGIFVLARAARALRRARRG